MPDHANDTRALDHVVLPVESLEETRARHCALGFTVAADARHPFGTENACMFLADGGYLEPLAIGDRADYDAAVAAGNVFVGRDHEIRKHGAEGISALVAATRDADADHARIVDAGLSAGDMLTFERPVKLADGSMKMGRFKLAFAADERSPAFFAFACERLVPLAIDRERLTRHANGAARMSSAILAADDPSAALALLREVFRPEKFEQHDEGIEFDASGTHVAVLAPDGIAARYGIAHRSDIEGLVGAALVFAVADIEVTAGVLAANGVPSKRHGARIVVGPARGQGVSYIFEETA